MIELGDQLVDALRHVLPLLIRFQKLALEGADPLALAVDLAAELHVQRALRAAFVGERSDRTLEPREVMDVPVVGRNRGTPPATNRTDDRRRPSSAQSQIAGPNSQKPSHRSPPRGLSDALYT